MSALSFAAPDTAEAEWAALLAMFERSVLDSGLASATMSWRRFYLQKVTAFWRQVAPGQLDADDGEALLDHLERQYTGGTLRQVRRQTCQLLDWAVEQGWTSGNVLQLALTRRELERRRHDEDAVTGEWRWALEAYRDWLQRRQFNAGTVKNYLGAVRTLQDHLGQVDPWAVTPVHFVAFYEAFADAKYASRRRNVAAFYDWAQQDGHVMVNVARVVLNRRHRQRKVVPPAWSEAIDEYLKYLAAGHRTRRTRDQRLCQLRSLAESLAPTGPWEVKHGQLIDYLAREDIAASTRRGLRSAVSGFYDWATRTKKVRHNPAKDLPGVRVPRARPRPAPDPYIESVMSTADPRLRLMLLLGACAGLRANEIATLHRSDVDTFRRELHITGKGGVQRVVPLHPLLEQHLLAWMGSREGFVFAGRIDGHLSGHYVSHMVSRALPPGWTAHTLRHRFASVGYAATRDLRAMQELLGHASPATTAIYTAVTDVALVETVAAVGFSAAAAV